MSNVGRESDVAASASLTLVKVGASGVIEEGAGRRQHPRQMKRSYVNDEVDTMRRYSVSHVDDLG